MQILHDLHEIFLGLLLAGDVRKTDSFRRFDIDLGVALAHAEHHRGGPASRAVHHSFAHEIAEPAEDRDGQHPAEEKSGHGRRLRDDVAPELGAGGIQPVHKSVVLHMARGIDLSVLVRKQNIVRSELYFFNLFVLGHCHEGPVIHFLNGSPLKRRHDKGVDDHHEQNDRQRVIKH